MQERINKVNSVLVYVSSVFQTLQTTDPGAQREPPENHAKVRKNSIYECEKERKNPLHH